MAGEWVAAVLADLADITNTFPGTPPGDTMGWLLWVAGGAFSALLAYVLNIQRRITNGDLVPRQVVEDIRTDAAARIAENIASTGARLAEVTTDRNEYRRAAQEQEASVRELLDQNARLIDGLQTVDHLVRSLPQPQQSRTGDPHDQPRS